MLVTESVSYVARTADIWNSTEKGIIVLVHALIHVEYSVPAAAFNYGV